MSQPKTSKALTKRRQNNLEKEKGTILFVRSPKEHIRNFPLFPAEVKVRLKTAGFYRSVDITNSITEVIVTNSLLTTAHAMDDVGQTEYLEDFAKNWTSYRVEGYAVKLSMIARAATAGTLLSIQQLATVPAYATNVAFNITSCASECSELVHGPIILPSVAGSPSRLDFPPMKHTIAQIAGPKRVLDPASYEGTITNAGVFASPAERTNVVLHMGPTPAGLFVVSESPLIMVELIQDAVFFDRRVLN
jgi:hypothetical protein